MLTSPLAPYLLWSKQRPTAPIDLANSNLLQCSIDDLPGAREALELSVPNENGYDPVIDALARHYGVAADRIATAPGCSGANFAAIAATVGARDDVLIERPTYDPLIAACRLMGANVRRFDRRAGDRYALDLDAVRAQLTSQTRLIIVTTPHNPSGVMIEKDALAGLGKIAGGIGAIVLVDEVYRDGAALLRDGQAPPSAMHLNGPFIVTSSLTKSYGLAGLRCGWAVAPPDMAERLRRTRDLVDSVGSAPSDRLSALALGHIDRLIERTGRLLTTNVACMRSFLSTNTRFEVVESPAASVCFPSIVDLRDADQFVQTLLERYGVAVVPGRFFESPDRFRVSLAGRSEALAEGLTRMSDALERSAV